MERESLQVSEGLGGERATQHAVLAVHRGEREPLWVLVDFRGEHELLRVSVELRGERTNRVEQELVQVLAELLDDNRNLLLSQVYLIDV